MRIGFSSTASCVAVHFFVMYVIYAVFSYHRNRVYHRRMHLSTPNRIWKIHQTGICEFHASLDILTNRPFRECPFTIFSFRWRLPIRGRRVSDRSHDDRIGAMNIYMRGVQFIQSYLNGQQNDNNNQGEQVCSDGVQSIPPRCNDSQSSIGKKRSRTSKVRSRATGQLQAHRL